MSNETSSKQTIDTFKLYTFPIIMSVLASFFSILSFLIYQDITELKTDVKTLLAQSNVDKTKIEILEKQVNSLNQATFQKKSGLGRMSSLVHSEMLYGKHEDIYDVNKNIKHN